MSVKIIKARKTISETAAPVTRLRVCAYARVSTDSEDQETSYDAQVRHYTDFISANPAWQFAGIFADEGISGTQAKTRPGFGAMIEACERGEIDMVITKSISRFARNTLDCLNYIRRLKALSIPIVFEKENINTMDSAGEVLVTILASIAQQESASISQNVTMGYRYSFEQGRGPINTSVFLGYTASGRTDSLQIVPGEAGLVRRMYRLYLEGYSPAMICRLLMAEKIPAPSGRQVWYVTTVQSILSNEKYCGDLLLQKYYTVDFLTHKVARNRGQRPQYFVEQNHEPIVPRAVFFQVQGEIRRRGLYRQDPEQIRFGNRLALKGRLVCGKCGRTLKRYVKPDQDKTDWRCRQRAMVKKTNEKEGVGVRCSCRIVRETEAEWAVIAAFNQLPGYRAQLVQNRERLTTGEMAGIDRVLQDLTTQQETLEYRLEMPTQIEMKRAIPVANGSAAEDADTRAALLLEKIEEIQRRRDALYVSRAEAARTELQIRILLELLDQMAGAVSCVHAAGVEDGQQKDGMDDPACRDYEDFFRRTAYTVPEGVLDGAGRMRRYENDLVIRYLDRITVLEKGYTVRFKAGIEVRIDRSED